MGRLDPHLRTPTPVFPETFGAQLIGRSLPQLFCKWSLRHPDAVYRDFLLLSFPIHDSKSL
jgi:hypothetical protein